MEIKELPYTVYPPCGKRTEWTVRFHCVTFEEAVDDAYQNVEFEIDYLKGKGIDILKDLEDKEG